MVIDVAASELAADQMSTKTEEKTAEDIHHMVISDQMLDSKFGPEGDPTAASTKKDQIEDAEHTEADIEVINATNTLMSDMTSKE